MPAEGRKFQPCAAIWLSAAVSAPLRTELLPASGTKLARLLKVFPVLAPEEEFPVRTVDPAAGPGTWPPEEL